MYCTSDADFFLFLAYAIVIPDCAKMSWSVRADAWAALEPLRERVVSCFECLRFLSSLPSFLSFSAK